MSVNPYLIFNGQCAEAMRFYERALGGRLERMMTFAEMPDANIPPGSGERIMHARMQVGDSVIMASDSMPGMAYEGMHGFSISVSYATAAESRRVYDALAPGGKVTMEFQKTFWSEGFGMLVDRYGTPWMVNTESPHG
jgi:PhnB protein